MDEKNPYHPPKEFDASVETPRAPWWQRSMGVLVLATATGISTSLFLIPPPNDATILAVLWGLLAGPIILVFWFGPILALLVATSMGYGTESIVALLKKLFESVREFFLSLTILVAGYIAFGVTCCGGNFSTGVVRLHAPPKQDAGLIATVVTIVSVLFGCTIVYGVQHCRTVKARSLDADR